MGSINSLLKPKHFFAGLRLEDTEDIVTLSRGNEVLAVFSAYGTTPEEILKEADKYVNKENEKCKSEN